VDALEEDAVAEVEDVLARAAGAVDALLDGVVDVGDGAEEEEALVWTGEAGGGAGAQEEQALTAEALNDLFYLLDAQAEAVNALEAAFSMDPAVSEDEDDAEDDERSENMQRAIEDIRKIFDVDDIPEEDIPDDFKPPDAQW